MSPEARWTNFALGAILQIAGYTTLAMTAPFGVTAGVFLVHFGINAEQTARRMSS